MSDVADQPAPGADAPPDAPGVTVRVKKHRPTPPGRSRAARAAQRDVLGLVAAGAGTNGAPADRAAPSDVAEWYGAGRPKFDPRYVEEVRKLALLGATTADIADFFDVSTRIIITWCSINREFSEALHGGRDAFTARVEHALAMRAIGYSYDTEKIFLTKDGDVVRVPYREHVPPDVSACTFWLKNRSPDRWRDVQNLRHSGEVTVKVTAEEAEW